MLSWLLWALNLPLALMWRFGELTHQFLLGILNVTVMKFPKVILPEAVLETSGMFLWIQQLLYSVLAGSLGESRNCPGGRNSMAFRREKLEQMTAAGLEGSGWGRWDSSLRVKEEERRSIRYSVSVPAHLRAHVCSCSSHPPSFKELRGQDHHWQNVTMSVDFFPPCSDFLFLKRELQSREHSVGWGKEAGNNHTESLRTKAKEETSPGEAGLGLWRGRECPGIPGLSSEGSSHWPDSACNSVRCR